MFYFIYPSWIPITQERQEFDVCFQNNWLLHQDVVYVCSAITTLDQIFAKVWRGLRVLSIWRRQGVACAGRVSARGRAWLLAPERCARTAPLNRQADHIIRLRYPICVRAHSSRSAERTSDFVFVSLSERKWLCGCGVCPAQLQRCGFRAFFTSFRCAPHLRSINNKRV